MTYSESYFRTRETWRDWRIEARQMMHLARVSQRTRVLEIGCGGVVAKLVEQGFRVGIVDLTDGEPTPGSPGPV